MGILSKKKKTGRRSAPGQKRKRSVYREEGYGDERSRYPYDDMLEAEYEDRQRAMRAREREELFRLYGEDPRCGGYDRDYYPDRRREAYRREDYDREVYPDRRREDYRREVYDRHLSNDWDETRQIDREELEARLRAGRRPRRRKKKRRGPIRFLLRLCLLVLVIGGLLAGLLITRVRHVPPVADTTADAGTEAAGISLMKDARVRNIMLIGSDAREGEERQRSDSMILCSINSADGTISFTSLMRDMYVPIPGYGADKMNAAYQVGDLDMLDQTVQQNFGVDVNGNALVDFEGFLEAMTAVGDLRLTLTAEEAGYLNGGGWEDQGGQGDEEWNLQEGENIMNPRQVLAYSRMRYVGNSDWDRTERQRKVLTAALQKFRRSNPVVQYIVLYRALPHITTDMTNWNLIRSGFAALLIGTDSMQSNLIPAEGTYYADTIDGMDVLVPDLEANSIYIRQYAYGSLAE